MSDKRQSGTKCIVPYCRRSRRDTKGLRLFLMPESNSFFRDLWIKRCGLDKNLCSSDKRYWVCGRHFLPSDVGKKYLRKGAVPSRNLRPDDIEEADKYCSEILNKFDGVESKDESNTSESLGLELVKKEESLDSCDDLMEETNKMDINMSTTSTSIKNTKKHLWTQESLRSAIESIQNNFLSVRQASIQYGIPRRTLTRRLQKRDPLKNDSGIGKLRLGQENELELVKYIKDLEATGYVHSKKELRKIAYDFAKKKGLEHVFDKNTLMAGNRWLLLFLRRHPEIKPSDVTQNVTNDSNGDEGDDEDNQNNELIDEETDSQDFEVKFDEDISDEEKEFYLKFYSSVDQVVNRRTHCTVCDEHIGTAPSQESLIRMHPVLKVTHCKKCHDFYNSGEFSKGEDGSELYCRWCGQGGEVYCCSKCPYVFCKNCIILNLPPTIINDIEENENWNCFVCAPKIMWYLRAQHWALTNFIEKQKRSILSKKYTDSEIRKLMTCDLTTCCGNKSTIKRSTKSLGNISDSSVDNENLANKKKSIEKKVRTPIPKRVATDSDSCDEQPKLKKLKSNDEVVCTPDVLSMLQTENSVSKKNDPIKERKVEQSKQIAVQQVESLQRSQQRQVQIQTPTQTQQTTTIRPIAQQVVVSANQQNQPTIIQTQSQQPPPLIIRNYAGTMRTVTPTVVTRKTVVGSRPPSSNSPQVPVYHTINGFRIDLNSAAQQETFRLPNGKLIQVKRQGAAPNVSQNQQNSRITIPNQVVRTQINPRNIQQSRAIVTQQGNQSVQHLSLQQPQLATIRYSTTPAQNVPTNATITATIPSSSGTILLNGAAVQQLSRPSTQIVAPAAISATTSTAATPALSSSSSSATLARQLFSATPLGQARSQLQNQIFIAMEICQYLTGKIHSLTNSNAYKSVKNFSDVKDLYIHLSYLFTYAIGRFKGLQDKCLEDMKKLGFAGDAASLKSGQLLVDKHGSDGDDDDIEIVEPKTTCIDLDSDNEDNSSSPIKKNQQSTKNTTTVSNNLSLLISNQSEVSTHSPSPSPSGSVISPSVSPTSITTSTTPIPETDKTSSDNDLSVSVNLLADMLGVELHEIDDSTKISPQSNNSSSNDSNGGNGLPKKPRKKTTNKPNPHLIKQLEMQQREKVQELIRNDVKLNSECLVRLEKIDLNKFEKVLVDNLEKSNIQQKVQKNQIKESEDNIEDTEKTENDNTMKTYNRQSVSVDKKSEIGQKPVVTQDIIDEILEESTEKILQFSKKSSMSKNLNENETMKSNSENLKDDENNVKVVKDSSNATNEMIKEEKLQSLEQEIEGECKNKNNEEVNKDCKVKSNDNDEEISVNVEPMEIDEIITTFMNKAIMDQEDNGRKDENMKESNNEVENNSKSIKKEDIDNSINKSFNLIDESSNKSQDSLLESVSDATLTDYVTKEDVAELLNSVESCSKYNECEKNVDEITTDNFLADLSTDSIMKEENTLSDVSDNIQKKNNENNVLLDDSNDTITLRDCLLDCLPDE